MKKNMLIFSAFFIFSTIFLTFSYYRDGWGIVEKGYYENWQTNFDRTVIARLVKNRQNGYLSAGGLLGLGDVEAWDFLNKTSKHQYKAYTNGGKFTTYLAYTSTPGFQGVVFGVLDQLLTFSPNVKINIFRAVAVVTSAMALAVICGWSAVEFGWLAGIFTVLFVGLSEVLIRAAGSIYWNLWVFYLPLIVCTIFLSKSSKKQAYSTAPLLWAIYITCLFKVLMNGFEGITTVMVMTTVPFVYFAVLDQWNWKVFLWRGFVAGLALSAAVVTGLLILSIQIALEKGDFSASTFYIWDAFSRRAVGNPDEYTGIMADSMRASGFDIIWGYLHLDSFVVRIQQQTWHIVFLQVFMVFVLCTLIFILKYQRINASYAIRKGWAFVLATWYSFLAPISWYIVFSPDAYFHTSLYTMLWHMPFTLLGTSLCGFVIVDLFKRNPTNA